MNEEASEALAGLRQIRDRLGGPNAPRRINLRAQTRVDGPAWHAYVKHCGLPGRKVRRATMLANINRAIDATTAELLGEGPLVETAPVQAAAQPRSGEGVAVGDSVSVQIRRFKPSGIELAQQFLDQVRENPSGGLEPPDELLFDPQHSDAIAGGVQVERRRFLTRRAAAEYLTPRLEPITSLISDQASAWSWLGMFYLPLTAPVHGGLPRLSPLNETFVVDRASSRSYQQRYRHYLWGSWRLKRQHGENASYLLDQALTSWPHIAHRSMSSVRIFNSAGVIPLILRLYTSGDSPKRGFQHSRGGIEHLIRVFGSAGAHARCVWHGGHRTR